MRRTEIPDESDECYFRLLEIQEPQEIQRYLNQVRRSSPALAQRLEQLVAVRDEALEYFDLAEESGANSDLSVNTFPTVRGDVTEAHAVPASGQQLGNYRLLEVIGEGGMGVVYLGEQFTPVRRRTAIKVIKPGPDSNQVMSRFEAERQALAMVNHPNIARVFDAGTTGYGQPYFVMELVEGEPITSYAERHQLSVDERLRLIQQACAAMQHAHNKGIIHRDIKPSNVLVTELDGAPVVKLIDFGIAKILRESLDDHTLSSLMSPGFGTPLYMSPEQAVNGGRDVDTRSDVYSLGVVAYELMCGSTPLPRESCRGLEGSDLLKKIDQTGFLRPSRRLKNESKTSDSRSFAGQSTASLVRRLDGEVDWIVMRALERDPARRYQSPRDLDEDIERHLSGRAVYAGPPSRWYHLRKWSARHRIQIAAAASILLAVLLGAVVSGWAAARAMRAERTVRSSLAAQEQKEAELRRLLYASDMKSAAEHYQQGDIPEMRDVLRKHLVFDSPAEDLRGFGWFHYWKKSEHISRNLLHLEDAVRSIAVSPSGRRIAAGDADGHVFLMDAQSFKPLFRFDTRQDEAWSLHFISENQLACGGHDGNVVVYQPETGEKLATYEYADSGRCAFTWLDDRSEMFVSGLTGELHRLRWNGEDFESVGNNPVFRLSSRVERLAVAVDEATNAAYVIAGDHGGQTFVLDVVSGQTVLHDEQASGMGPVRGVTASFDGRLVAQVQGRGLLSVYETIPQPRLLFRSLLPGDLHSVSFGADGRWIYAGDAGGYVHRLPVSGDPSEIFAQSGPSLADRTRSWKLHDQKIDTLCLLEDRSLMLTGGRDGKLLASGLSSDATRWKLPISASDFEFAENGDLYAADGTLKRVQAPYRDSEIQILDSGSPSVNWQSLAIAELAGALFAVADDRRLSRWSMRDPQREHFVWEPSDGEHVRNWTVTPDGELLLVNLERNDPRSHRLACVELETGQERYSFSCNLVNALSVSPDARHYAFSRNNSVEVRELESGKLLHQLPGHTTSIREVAFNLNGDTLASVANDRTIQCWQLPSGEPLWSAIAHDNRANALAFSPDRRSLATAGADSVIRMWRYRTGQFVSEIAVEEGSLGDMRFAPGGETLAISTKSDGIVMLHGPRDVAGSP